jgi:ribonuclease T2
MNTYWLSDDESANDFWAHEWNTHGTCINTIEPSCYTDYTDNEEVGDFFQEVVDLFKTLDTYTVIVFSFFLCSRFPLFLGHSRCFT